MLTLLMRGFVQVLSAQTAEPIGKLHPPFTLANLYRVRLQPGVVNWV